MGSHDKAIKHLEMKQRKLKMSLDEAAKSETELESFCISELCIFDKQALKEVYTCIIPTGLLYEPSSAETSHTPCHSEGSTL